jgi:hypothetical protein
MPPSPFLSSAGAEQCSNAESQHAPVEVAAAVSEQRLAPVLDAAADLWSRGEALLAEIYAYLAEAERTFDLDAERFMAELDEAPLFLRSA